MLYFASSLLLPYLMLQHNSDRMDYSQTKLIACNYRLQGYSYHQRERNSTQLILILLLTRLEPGTENQTKLYKN